MNGKSFEAPINSSIYYRNYELLSKFAKDLRKIAKALDDFCIAITNCRKSYNIF